MKERSSKSSPSSASSLKTSPSDRVLIGRIVGSFGIKGEVKIQPLTDFEERFDLGLTVFVRSSPRKIESSRFHKGQWLLGLEGCTSRSAAEELQWEDVYAPSEGRPELPQDTFLTEDLIGMEVFEEDGTSLGVVAALLSGARSAAASLRPTGACGPWRGGWPGPCGRPRSTCGSGSRGGASGRASRAGRYASRRISRGIEGRHNRRPAAAAAAHPGEGAHV